MLPKLHHFHFYWKMPMLTYHLWRSTTSSTPRYVRSIIHTKSDSQILSCRWGDLTKNQEGKVKINNVRISLIMGVESINLEEILSKIHTFDGKEWFVPKLHGIWDIFQVSKKAWPILKGSLVSDGCACKAGRQISQECILAYLGTLQRVKSTLDTIVNQ